MHNNFILFRSLSTVLSSTENGRIQGLFKAFEWFSSTFQGRFNFQESALNSSTFQACVNTVNGSKNHIFFFYGHSEQNLVQKFIKWPGCEIINNSLLVYLGNYFLLEKCQVFTVWQNKSIFAQHNLFFACVWSTEPKFLAYVLLIITVLHGPC